MNPVRIYALTLTTTLRAAHQVDTKSLKRWLKKSRDIQWDYKNIVKRKGVLKRLK